MNPLTLKTGTRFKFALLFILTIATGKLNAQSFDIIGSYTIDPAGGVFDPGVNDNFLSFSEAVDTLISRGVGGSVNIDVADGFYDEAFVLAPIPGSGPANIVTFQSASRDSSKVFMNYSGFSSSSVGICNFNGASYVAFKHLGFDATGGNGSYGQAFWIGGGSHHIYIENNNFIGKTTGTSSTQDNRALIMGWGNDIEYLEFRNNRFTFGEDGIKISGTSGARGIIIDNNQFYDQLEGAIYLRESDAPLVRNNKIVMETYTRRTGIQLELVDKGFEVSGNTVNLKDCSAILYMRDCDGNPGDEGRIFNNFFTNKNAGGSNNHGIWLRNSTYLKIYHNSVGLKQGWITTSSCFFQEYGGNNVDVQNNSFQNHSAGYCFSISDGSAISKSDYNNYYTRGNYIARWGSSNLPKLSDLVSSSSDNTSSIEVNSMPLSIEDLHTTNYRLDGKGTNLIAVVSVDIDGEPRSATPDIGADEFVGEGAPLSGEYYVGGSNPDFLDFDELTLALHESGVDGPVTFSIRDDGSPYTAVLSIPLISGTSATNTVTFRPDPANTGDVIIAHDGSSGGNQTVHIVRASNVIITGLIFSADNSTNSTVIRLNSLCENIQIDGNTINSLGTSSNNAAIYSIDDLINDIRISGNTFTGGNRGIHIDGFDNSSLKPKDIIVSNNTFFDHYSAGVYMRDCNAPDILNNEISPGSSNYNYWGIWLEYCNNNYEISKNKIRTNADDGGIAVSYSSGSSSFTGKIVNNFVDVYEGSESMSGILTQNSTYIDVYFNTSIIFRGNSNTGSNSYTNQSGSNIKVKNNNFVNFGSGRAYYNDNTNAITESDFNNVFATGINLARWGANEQQSFEDLRSASSKDVNSLSVNPWFLQDGDPGINSSFLDGKGTQISGISTDFFNITRQNPPDIGAAEFSATDQAFSEGTYTIGGDSPDYPTVVDGIAALMERGVSGPVVFNIRPGEYNEHVGYIFKIPGSSAVNTVTVKSETGNPEDVRVYQLTDNTGGAFNVINMKGLEYFTLRDITLSALGNSNGRPLTINGTSKHVSIVNNILTSANTATYCMTVGGVFDDLLIKDNTITKGYGGIYFEASSTRYGTNNEISGNSISGSQYTGIHMRYQFSPHIKNNNILNTLYPGYEGMNIQDCQDELVVTGNRINNQNSDYGIKLINCDATNPFYGLVANNFVRIGFDYEASGIYLDNCTRTFIYHNSVNITSTHTDRGRGIYTSANNSELEIVNNNLACTGQGYAMVLGDLNDAPVIDYNNLYTNGANLVWDNGSVYTDISAWQSASGRDANSISVDPMFNNDSDLHSMQLAFHKAGTPLSEVTVDIDSMPRDPSTPDLGAAEFSCMTPEFNVFVTPVCLGDTTLIIDSTRYIAPGSTRGWDFTGDLVPDVYTDNQYDTVKWVFEEAGSSSITYIVQQIAGCNDFITLDAAVIPEPVLQIETKGAYCDSTDGWASATVTNIEGPFQYFWSNGSTDSLATKLALGLYTVAVADETGCTASEEVTIGEAIEVTFSNLSPSTCGIHDGSATVNAEGGFAPYDYVWSNGYTTATNDSLAPGPHYVNVIDSKGCYSAAALNVDSDGGPQILLSASNNNDCYGEQFGSLDISISSGVAPYDILWSNGETTEDIEGLASGTYNVVVQDAEGCLGAGSFQISQPAQISISPNVTPATCEGSDGSAVAIISGGSRPFIYQWSSGGIYKIEEGLAAGVYSVTVTDAKGCEMVEPVIVNNINAPLVAITDVQGVGCTVTDNGAISVSASPPNPFYSYAWSSGQTTPTINNLTEGTYVITVTDSEGCKGVNQAVVEQEPPDANPICIVSVDTVTGKNMLIWVKENIEDVSHYNIYRESSIKGDYQVIASVDVGEESVYIDEVADPSIRSWRYKLSVVDVCGIESELSLHHKTMHLTMNKGLDGDVNLIWDHYEGFPVNTYKVWRYEPGSGWENITDMPSNLTSYTDKNPPNESLTYFIEVLHPGGCTSSEKKPATLNSARSNRRSSKKSVTPGSVVEELFSDYQFGIYPNPSFGRFNIELEHDNLDKATVKIFDVSGKILEKIEYKDIHGRLDTQLDLSGYTDGMYQVQITTEHLILHRILVKE